MLKISNERKEAEFYLGYPTKTVRVPKFFYKIIYQPSTRNGIAVVTSNDPYLKNTKSATFCANICHKYNWMLNDNKEGGYTFCCTMDSFYSIVKEAPHFKTVDVLKFPRMYNMYLILLN